MTETTEKLLNTIAKNIRAIRLDKELSQEHLASICGLHRTYIGSVERMERNITITTLAKFANALEVTAIDLLTEKGN